MSDTTRKWWARLGGRVVSGMCCVLLPMSAAHAASAGWDYVIEKLAADGVSRERVEAAFQDPRVEPFGGLQFSLEPRESASIYRGFLKPPGIRGARQCFNEHRKAFDAAERESGVEGRVVAAIIFVESGCGRNTGTWAILPRLARLAMANEPDNVEQNLARHLENYRQRPPAEIERMTRWRAQWLENTFYPEVRATFDLADRLGVAPIDIRGSGSGAVGVPQFLPTHYLRYGQDGDGDGHISLHDVDDAIPSCASYLKAYGWRPGLSAKERRNVVWEYNHSRAYIDAVLGLADRLETRAAPKVVAAKAPARKRAQQARTGHRRQARRAATLPGG